MKITNRLVRLTILVSLFVLLPGCAPKRTFKTTEREAGVVLSNQSDKLIVLVQLSPMGARYWGPDMLNRVRKRSVGDGELSRFYVKMIAPGTYRLRVTNAEGAYRVYEDLELQGGEILKLAVNESDEWMDDCVVFQPEGVDTPVCKPDGRWRVSWH